MSIRLRLTLWYSGLFAVAFVVFGLIVYNVVYHNTMSELRDRLIQVATKAEAFDSRFPNEYNLNINSSAPGFDSTIIGMQLIDYSSQRSGIVAGKSNNMVRWTITFPNPDQENARKRFVTKQIGDLPFYIYEHPLVIKGTNTVIGLLQVGVFARGEFALFSKLKTILWISGAIGLLAAFLLGMFLSRKALMPINRVTEAAERIRSGSGLGLRIPREKPNDEIGRLTDTLNGMLSGLEGAYKTLEDSNIAQRRFVSDASHELRTPLTTIRGNVDLLEKIWLSEKQTTPEVTEEGLEQSMLSEEDMKQFSLESIRDIADEARRMSSLVNDLLSLARADAGYSIEMENVPLRPLTEEASRRAAFLPRKAEWAVGPLEALDGIEVRGNRDYLLQLLFILIENGFKYTPSGVVRLYAVRSEEYVGLSVADTGIGIRAEEVPHIFERFYRVDVSRGETSGTGLGLSIAKWIADMHQAKIEVRTQLGEGTVFTLWLPILTNMPHVQEIDS
ncbi:sensor histidine kinase [Cohnella luojiensis]|uniref:histidine kinase n=1 Tax=Cohnella luojiensis TaxID=652876 RepID=A0A4Y8LR66_9BACL|nr:HAMP domain-containing sensor histidine kinase [Cohnella luojiensis]TFE19776.1 HAMP domain-containing histidine kinase [Cohnella luojiensis]